MARKLRIQYAGAIYHVMSRGGHGEDIFRGGQGRETLLQTLGQACEKTDWPVQPAPQALRPPVQRALQDAVCGWERSSPGYSEGVTKAIRKLNLE